VNRAELAELLRTHDVMSDSVALLLSSDALVVAE
jgi:hypothetical protein